MTIAVDPADYGAGRRLPGIAVAAVASIGAGAVHAAAAGVHAEHPSLARIFVIGACLQLAAGLWALTAPRRLAAAAIAVVNGAAVTGWVVTRLTGISWINGLEVKEAPQFADSSCAILGVVAVGAAAAALVVGWHPGRPSRLGLPGLAAAALTIPAMISGGTHVHSHEHTAAGAEHAGGEHAGADHAGADHADGDHHDVEGVAGASSDTAHPEDHADGHTGDHTADHADETATTADGAAATGDEAHGDEAHGDEAHGDEAHGDEGHGHGEDEAAGQETAAAVWPRPWDPSEPLDLSGVPGVTPEQEARARELVERSLIEMPRWADTAAAIADGYRSIGDAGTGSEHYINVALVQDDVLLDPTQPESLVYTVRGEERILAGAMFIAPAQPTDSPELVEWAGPLMTWHNHGNLCWDRDETGAAKVVGVTDDAGRCARGVNTGGANPMVHVWITPHPCGVFAALEGVGAGQAAVPEEQRVDMCQEHHGRGGEGGHGHGSSAVPTVPYDPKKPIDLGGIEGVTPEQQAAAENLVAVNVVRLPQWADHRVAEAAGFHSIGDGATGHEHYINWAWINDDVALDPDHPESLVYEPQPDGSKKLVSAMYMLPDDVALEDVPDIGGPLMQWHIHDDLCFTKDPVAPRVAGLTNAAGGCPAGLQKFRPAPMIHVWIVPNRCGPFASLDGVAAGQILEGEERLCDVAHGSGGLL